MTHCSLLREDIIALFFSEDSKHFPHQSDTVYVCTQEGRKTKQRGKYKSAPALAVGTKHYTQLIGCAPRTPPETYRTVVSWHCAVSCGWKRRLADCMLLLLSGTISQTVHTERTDVISQNSTLFFSMFVCNVSIRIM